MVELEWRDEKGRGVLEWTCIQDVHVGLVKYLIEERGMRIEKDSQDRSCLDLDCEQYERDKGRGVS